MLFFEHQPFSEPSRQNHHIKLIRYSRCSTLGRLVLASYYQVYKWLNPGNIKQYFKISDSYLLSQSVKQIQAPNDHFSTCVLELL